MPASFSSGNWPPLRVQSPMPGTSILMTLGPQQGQLIAGIGAGKEHGWYR